MAVSAEPWDPGQLLGDILDSSCDSRVATRRMLRQRNPMQTDGRSHEGHRGNVTQGDPPFVGGCGLRACFADRVDGVQQSDVRERLREVAQQTFALGVVLLAEEADIVSQRRELL